VYNVFLIGTPRAFYNVKKKKEKENNNNKKKTLTEFGKLLFVYAGRTNGYPYRIFRSLGIFNKLYTYSSANTHVLRSDVRQVGGHVEWYLEVFGTGPN